MKPKFVLLAGFFAAIAMTFFTEAEASGFATYWARVSAAGAVLRSSGVANSAHTGGGVYDISFNRSVSSCVHVASLNEPTAGYATVELKSAAVLTVHTFASNGAKTNRNFSLMVSCAP